MAQHKAVSFDETLSGNQALFGGFAGTGKDNLFDPLSHDAKAVTLSVHGRIKSVGDTINFSLSTHGVSASGTATYEGFYFVGSEKVYVFHPSTEVPGFGSAFAVTETGQPIPLTSGTVRLDTGAADTCFLRGTMIGTAHGEVAVEDIAAGDQVSVMVDGRAVSRPVTWVGRRSVSLDPARADVDAYPVRIRAGAFREQVPHRDLLVTSEHCLFVDGMLVPARMLVNGSSITVARDILAFDYFHVELERHAILVAEGLETESYLDTGNRHTFAGGEAVPAAAPRSWAADAAAPLTVDQARVEPIWRRLAARAATLGLTADADAEAALSAEPMLRLVTRSGMEIAPSLVDGGSYAFVVPGGVDAVRLRSRTARPSETVGPFLDDRRDLGVLVGRIAISDGRRRRSHDAHLSGARLSGWHAAEAGAAARWTNGDASLTLDLDRTGNRPVFLDIEVLAAGPYRDVPAAMAA